MIWSTFTVHINEHKNSKNTPSLIHPYQTWNLSIDIHLQWFLYTIICYKTKLLLRTYFLPVYPYIKVTRCLSVCIEGSRLRWTDMVLLYNIASGPVKVPQPYIEEATLEKNYPPPFFLNFSFKIKIWNGRRVGYSLTSSTPRYF